MTLRGYEAHIILVIGHFVPRQTVQDIQGDLFEISKNIQNVQKYPKIFKISKNIQTVIKNIQKYKKNIPKYPKLSQNKS